MTKKQIKKLAEVSYTNNFLDAKKVERIAKNLTRGEIKEYISALKTKESKTSVIINIPAELSSKIKEKFQSFFPDKKIIYKVNPSLLVGVRIKNDDLIYNYNLKDTLEDLTSVIG